MQRLDQRSRDIFREIVEGYLATGEPVGSRTLSKGSIALSPASIRNVMADLTDLGLLDAPHISAGRAPTHMGLRLFVDGFLEIGEPARSDRLSDRRPAEISRGRLSKTSCRKPPTSCPALPAALALSLRRSATRPCAMSNSCRWARAMRSASC
jgi:transcriptional regulator of heat shock response